MATQHFQAGDLIFEEGDRSQEAYYLISGTVEITIKTAAGPHVLAHLGPGEIFGEMGMINERPRSATARAVEPATVESVSEDVFESSILHHSDRLHAYLNTLFDRIRTTDLLLQMEWQKQETLPGASDRSRLLVVPGAGKSLRPHPDLPATADLLLKSAPEAPGDPVEITISRLPFRIGRAFGDTGVGKFAKNDLPVPDQEPYHISRIHCEIDHTDHGYIVRDRGSTLGTQVNGAKIGRHVQSHIAPLHAGDNQLILGGEGSPHHFVVMVSA